MVAIIRCGQTTRMEPATAGLLRGEHGADAPVSFGDRCIQVVDLVQVEPDQEGLMVAKPVPAAATPRTSCTGLPRARYASTSGRARRPRGPRGWRCRGRRAARRPPSPGWCGIFERLAPLMRQAEGLDQTSAAVGAGLAIAGSRRGHEAARSSHARAARPANSALVRPT